MLLEADHREAEILVADIGSTVTKLSAFAGLAASAGGTQAACFLGQGMALTTVAKGDVGLGLDTARRDLDSRLGRSTAGLEMMASASAAGGLRMTVHGLTPQMTLRAAREASLGAGAIVVFTTAGIIRTEDLDAIRQHRPKLLLLAGGVDYGDHDVVIANARVLSASGIKVPVLYAGNLAAAATVEQLFKVADVPIYLVENVYPRIDELNIEPVRERIQQVFSEHILVAPGMKSLGERINGRILPTPGAVMLATELLAESLGNVMTVDVGGATTDIHSVCADASEHEHSRLVPEPRAKRTVEGDLGVYINAEHIVAAADCDSVDIDSLAPIPDSESERDTAIELTRLACELAVSRHVGRLRPSYGISGRTFVIVGKDLSAVQTIIGTGGALTRLGAGEAVLNRLKRHTEARGVELLPPSGARIVIDRDYIVAAAGVIAGREPAASRQILLSSLGLSEQQERPCLIPS